MDVTGLQSLAWFLTNKQKSTHLRIISPMKKLTRSIYWKSVKYIYSLNNSWPAGHFIYKAHMPAVQKLNSILSDLVITNLLLLARFTGLLFTAFWEHLSRNCFPYASKEPWIHFHPLFPLSGHVLSTTASHKRHFALAHCSAFPQPIYTHELQTIQKTLKFVFRTYNYRLKPIKNQNRIDSPRIKIPHFLYFLPQKHEC